MTGLTPDAGTESQKAHDRYKSWPFGTSHNFMALPRLTELSCLVRGDGGVSV